MDCVDLVSWCQMFHRKHRKTIGKQCGMMIFTGLHGDFNDHHFRRFHGTIYKDIYTYSSFLGGSKGASQFDLGSREFYICQTNTSEIEQNSRHFPKFENNDKSFHIFRIIKDLIKDPLKFRLPQIFGS